MTHYLLPNHALTPNALRGRELPRADLGADHRASCWIYCYTWNPERPLTDAERARFRGGQTVHAEVDERYVPLRNRATTT